MSDQIGKPEDRFSHVAAHLKHDQSVIEEMHSFYFKKEKCCIWSRKHDFIVSVWDLEKAVWNFGVWLLFLEGGGGSFSTDYSCVLL